MYPIAPDTAPQLSVAPVCEIFVVFRPAGIAQAVDVVVKLAAVEYDAEQLALTCHV